MFQKIWQILAVFYDQPAMIASILVTWKPEEPVFIKEFHFSHGIL